MPDGTVDTYYYNAYGEQMLEVTTDATTGLSYGNFTEYNGQGLAIMTADAAAVELPSSLGTLEAYPSLLNGSGTSYEYLANNAGELTTTQYYTTTTATSTTPGGVANYEESTSIQNGQDGTPILQESMDYISRAGGSATIYPMADDTTYGGTGGTDARTTSDAYTWYSGTTNMQSQTVTLPVIDSGQNGPGAADTSETFYDAYGRPVWTKDGNGNVSYTAYDDATGAVVESITSVVYADLTTAQKTSFDATGWTDPTGGLNLVTTYQVDNQGRTTEMTSPNGNMTYTVYDDADREVRTYPGFNASTGTTTGPIQITRTVLPTANSGDIFYTETMTSSATPHLTDGVPDGTETLTSSNIQSLSRDFTNAAGQTIWTDSYANLTGVTFSEGVILSGGVPADLGTNGTNYYRTTFAYDAAGRQDKTIDPNGTITQTIYDGLGQALSTWVGTNDTPSSGYWSPTNNTGPSNMTEVSSNIYDNGSAGDGNLTEAITYPGGGTADRATLNYYDWRNRLVASKQGALVNSSGVPTPSAETDGVGRPISYVTYDNAGEAIEQQSFDGDGVTITSTDGVPNAPTSLLTAESTQSYDDQGRVYASTTYSVDPSTGAVGSGITTNTFYDHDGNVLATFTPGQPTSKSVYDGANRVIASYMTDGGAVNNGGTPLLDWADAGSVTNDVVVSQTDTTYDGDSNAILTTELDRLPTADTTTPGALTSSNARISYVADFYDAADRMTAEENVGTNGGTAWTRPSTPDASDDTHLVTTYGYDAAGNQNLLTDPRGIQALTIFDMLGRQTETIAAYTDGTPTSDTNQTTDYTYDGNNDVLTMTAVMPSGTPNQTTAYVYGFGVSGGLYDNDLLVGVQYPDATTGDASGASDDSVSYGYDNLGEPTSMVDQNGTAHAYNYDSLGRMTLDAVTTLGTGVDGSVMALGYSYNDQGLPYQQTSYSSATTFDAGTTINQDQDVYNGFGQITGEYQSVSGAVDTSTTPEVQYVYSSAATGSDPTEMIYPNGRILHMGYDNNTLDTAIGRVDYLADDNGSGGVGSHLADYTYLGLSSILSQADGNGVTLTTTLDQFGRVEEMKWLNTTADTATDDFQYGYDRDGNVLYKNNLVNNSFSELDHANSTTSGDNNTAYDPLSRLTGFSRGTLSSSGNNGTGLDTVTTPNTLAGSTQSFSLDAVGNQTSTTTDGTAVNKNQNSKNQLTGVGSFTLTYDNNGNTITDQNGNALTYDAWNRMVTDSAGSTSYTFDANGRRITETHGSTTTDLYFTTQGQVIEERVAGTVTAQNVWSIDYVNDLLLRDDNSTSGNLGVSGSGLGNRVYYQHDANYNETATIDNGGNVIQRYVYSAYGVQTVLTGAWATCSASNSIYGFQGGRFDVATGMNRFGARDYGPANGTWIEPDPVRYVDGTNRYQGNDSSPQDLTDPDGTVAGSTTQPATLDYQQLTWANFRQVAAPPPGTLANMGAATNAIHLSLKIAINAFHRALYRNVCASLPFLR